MPAAAASRTSASGVDRPSDAVVWRCRSITPIGGGGRRGAPALARDQAPVLANQQLEVVALLVGELEEDALAFRFLEPLAVPLEELVRAALAADADEQGLAIGAALS